MIRSALQSGTVLTAPAVSGAVVAADPALAAAYVPVAGTSVRRALGKKWAFLGDSITAGSGATQSWNNFVSTTPRLAGRSVQAIVNAGVGGNNTSQMLARFGTDVAGKGADTLHLLGGTNDASQAIPIATTAANIKAIVNKARALGMGVVLGTVPPRSATTVAIHKATKLINLWLSLYAARENIPLIDYHTSLVDTTTGYLLAANDSGDGTHPSDGGHYTMSQTLVNAVTSYNTNGAIPLPYLVNAAGDDTNLMPNPLLNGTVGAVGGSNGWYFGGPAGTFTTAILANDASITGQYYSVQLGNVNSSKFIYNAVPTSTITGGDKLIMVFKFFVDQLTQPALADVSIKVNGQFTDASYTNLQSYVVTQGNRPLNPGVPSYNEIIVPAGKANVEFDFVLATSASATTAARLKIAQVGVFNLTALGIDNL